MVAIIVSVVVSVIACVCRLLGWFTGRSVKERLRELMPGSVSGPNDGGMACDCGGATLEGAMDAGSFALAGAS